MSLDVPGDITKLSQLMNMGKTRDYKSFISCLQLVNKKMESLPVA